jgi:excisionase family DNA binding protein
LKRRAFVLELLKIDEASELLRLKRITIYKMVSRKAIPFVKIGSSLRFEKKALEKWIEQRSYMPLHD